MPEWINRQSRLHPHELPRSVCFRLAGAFPHLRGERPVHGPMAVWRGTCSLPCLSCPERPWNRVHAPTLPHDDDRTCYYVFLSIFLVSSRSLFISLYLFCLLFLSISPSLLSYRRHLSILRSAVSSPLRQCLALCREVADRPRQLAALGRHGFLHSTISFASLPLCACAMRRGRGSRAHPGHRRRVEPQQVAPWPHACSSMSCECCGSPCHQDTLPVMFCMVRHLSRHSESRH